MRFSVRNDDTLTISDLDAWLDLFKPFTPVSARWSISPSGIKLDDNRTTQGSKSDITKRFDLLQQIKSIMMHQLPTAEIQDLAQIALDLRKTLLPKTTGPLFTSVNRVAFRPTAPIDPINVAEMKHFFLPRYLCFDNQAGVLSDPHGITMPTILGHFDMPALREFSVHSSTARCQRVTMIQGVINTLYLEDSTGGIPAKRKERIQGIFTTNMSSSHTVIRICGLPSGPYRKFRVKESIRQVIEGADGEFFSFGPVVILIGNYQGHVRRDQWIHWASKHLKYLSKATGAMLCL